MKKILLVIMLIMTFLGVTYAGDSSGYDLEINIGNKGNVYLDKKIPINIKVTNDGEDFDGMIKIMIPLESNGQEKAYYSYDYIMQLPAGESKMISALESPDSTLESGTAKVQIVDKKGKIKYEETYRLRKSFDIKNTVGILSDDFDSLSYVKNTKSYDLVNLNDVDLEIENVFDIYDIVFINFYETSKLSQRVINSLEKFVDEGGQLILASGEYGDMSLKKLDFIGDLNIGEISLVSSIELQNITNVKVKNISDIKYLDVKSDGYRDINELVIKKDIGSGSVSIVKISLADDVFTSYSGGDKFINKFVEFKVANENVKYRGNSIYYIYNYISKIPSKFMPNPSLLIIFMIVFVILVGPATYIILNHIDKRDYGFIVIIAIVLLSITAIKAYGYSLNSNSDIVNHLSLLRADGDNLKVDSYIGFKGSKGDVDIALDKDKDISRLSRNTYIENNNYVYSKYSDEDNHIVFHNSKQWEFNNIKVNSSEKFNSEMASKIRLDGKNLKFDFKNDLGYDIDELILVYGNRLYYSSELLEGESFNFDKNISAMNTSSGGNIANSIYGYNSVLGLTEDYLKNDIVSGFLNTLNEGTSGAFLLLSTDEYSLEIKSDKSMKEQKLAYIYIPLDIEFKSGETVKVSSGVVKERVIESSGIERNNYNGYYDGNGYITFSYDIPKSIDLSKFEFDLYLSASNMFYEIYNVKADIWEKIDSSNFIVTSEKINNYNDGKIIIRATTSDYVDFEGPQFSFEGVGK